MPDRLSRRMVLLAAYEDFTRRESVSLGDDNFELMLKLQDKKAKVVAQLELLEDSPTPSESSEFKERIGKLLEQEHANDELLKQKMAANRKEFRTLSQNVVSAGKLRRAYAAPVDRSAPSGTLKGRA